MSLIWPYGKDGQLPSNVLTTDNPNQSTQALQVQKKPTEPNDVMRRSDFDWYEIVNHTTNLAANSIGEWSIRRYTIQPNTLYEFLFKTGLSQKDLVLQFKILVGSDINYHYNSATYLFNLNENELNTNNQIKFWLKDNKFKLKTNIALPNVKAFIRRVAGEG